MFMFNLSRRKYTLLTVVLALIMTSFFSLSVFAAKAVRDRTAPTAPYNLHALSITTSSVSITWSPSTDNVGVQSYNIFKDGMLIGNSLDTSYTINSLNSGTSYKFNVQAKDAAGNLSSQSNALLVTTTTVTPPPTQSGAKNVIGYYASWAAYSGFTPDKVDASKLTHINYAFANIDSSLKIALGDTTVDPTNFQKLSVLKQTYPNLKTLISVGGWSWSGKFSDVALTDTSRTTFADSCVQFILKYGFDGVDLDWEYPVSGGMSTNVRRPEDKQNFTLLLQKIREKLNAQSAIDGKKYLLTFAGASGSWYTNNVELTNIKNYVDFGNVMTYDIHGTWDSYTDFNAPLYNNSDVSPQYKWSVDSSIKAWTNAGFPAEKLIVGVPFYGNKYTSVTSSNNGLYQIFSGGSQITYANIAANYLNAPGFVRYFHSQSMVPWLFDGNTFISYEDEQSIAAKAQYIKNGAYGGAMVWELSQDPNKVLLNALYNGLLP